LAVLLVDVIALWLAPRALDAAEGGVRRQPLPALGWGLVAAIGYFILVIVLLIMMVILAIAFGLLGFGMLLGIDVVGGLLAIAAVTFGYIVAAGFLADAIVGLALGRAVVRRSR